MADQVKEEQTGLTVQDLTLTLQVIQVATSRGTFKADELTAIGGLYDRIFKFLESTGQIAKTDSTASTVTDTKGNE
jgi:effector-binding domain-containing protein